MFLLKKKKIYIYIYIVMFSQQRDYDVFGIDVRKVMILIIT